MSDDTLYSCATASLERGPSESAEAPARPTLPQYQTRSRRFDRVARLVGDDGLARLAASHVMVIGCGGVGSWAAESLARTGVGRISIVDFDRICETNVNRQLHAMVGTVGKSKVEVMAERLRRIAPRAQIDAVVEFCDSGSRDRLLGLEPVANDGLSARPDWVIDAIDNVTAKLDLLVACLRGGVPVITCLGAAGKLDPTRVKLADVGHTVRDGLARDVRKLLVRKYGLQPDARGSLGIPAVYSDEQPIAPSEVAADRDGEYHCVCPKVTGPGAGRHSCDHRARIDGTASFVTGTFGLVAASWVVRSITGRASLEQLERPKRPRPMTD